MTISPGSALPQINPVVIDGRTQGGFTGTPIVELAGNLAGPVSGLSTCGGFCGSSSIRGLVINRFSAHGISLSSPDNVVQGNYLGTDVAGSVDLGNLNNGVFIGSSGSSNTIGGTISAAGNLISGNNAAGIRLRAGTGGTAKSNWILGNRIGTDATGMIALGNGIGIHIDGFDSGADASANSIGSWSGAPNIISGNTESTYAGVLITGAGASSNTVNNNFIGLAADGTSDLGNAGSGLEIVGASDNEANSFIVGNDGAAGVRICGAGTTCSGYTVTTPASSNVIHSPTRANSGHGVLIESASGNSITGTTENNGGVGVRITGVTATGNFIWTPIRNNGGLGIDLDPAGVTPNDGSVADDADAGPNDLQNFPVVTSATITGGSLVAKIFLDSLPSTVFDAHIYRSSACDASGYGEGEDLFGIWPFSTDGNGEATFTLTYPGPPATAGEVITAVAHKDLFGSTSEFSACRTVEADADADTFGDGSDNCPSVANPLQENADGDAWGDACDPCPAYASFWAVPAGDGDCDGFTGADETLITTDPGDPCGFTAGGATASETWPPDLVESNSVNISDVLSLKLLFGMAGPARYNIVPAGTINISDVLAVKPYFGKSCTP